MGNSLNHLGDVFRNLTAHSEDWVLATIIETQGSTYRKAGAKMLISKEGECIGLLSGGCLENDLKEHAERIFADGRARTVFYDMRSPDDIVWGLGLGCNGTVRVILQLLKAAEGFHPLDVLAEAMENDRPGVLMTVFESAHERFPAGLSEFVVRDAFKNAQLRWPDEVIAAAYRAVPGGKPYSELHRVEGHDIAVFYDPVHPLPRLLIVGAGADAVPLVKSAAALGWRVTVADYRPAYIKPERFPTAANLVYSPPEILAEKLPLDRFDALVMMTHNFEYDTRYLKTIADSRIPFIGLLGPEARKKRLLDSLGDKASKIEVCVFGPVGLDIGAETPEEIALSIMAGILAAQKGRRGGQLSVKKDSTYA